MTDVAQIVKSNPEMLKSSTQYRSRECKQAAIIAQIRTTRIAGGLLLGYNPWKAGARLKTPAFTLFRPYCP